MLPANVKCWRRAMTLGICLRFGHGAKNAKHAPYQLINAMNELPYNNTCRKCGCNQQTTNVRPIDAQTVYGGNRLDLLEQTFEPLAPETTELNYKNVSVRKISKMQPHTKLGDTRWPQKQNAQFGAPLSSFCARLCPNSTGTAGTQIAHSNTNVDFMKLQKNKKTYVPLSNVNMMWCLQTVNIATTVRRKKKKY